MSNNTGGHIFGNLKDSHPFLAHNISCKRVYRQTVKMVSPQFQAKNMLSVVKF